MLVVQKIVHLKLWDYPSDHNNNKFLTKTDTSAALLQTHCGTGKLKAKRWNRCNSMQAGPLSMLLHGSDVLRQVYDYSIYKCTIDVQRLVSMQSSPDGKNYCYRPYLYQRPSVESMQQLQLLIPKE